MYAGNIQLKQMVELENTYERTLNWRMNVNLKKNMRMNFNERKIDEWT